MGLWGYRDFLVWKYLFPPPFLGWLLWGHFFLADGEGQVCCPSSRGSCWQGKGFLAVTLNSSDTPPEAREARQLVDVLAPGPFLHSPHLPSRVPKLALVRAQSP